VPVPRAQCGGLTVETLSALLDRHVAQSRKNDTFPGRVLLHDMEPLSYPAQARLSLHFADGAVSEGKANTTTSRFSPEELAQENRLSRDLWLRLTIGSLRMPALAERQADLPAITLAKLAALAERRIIAGPRLADGAAGWAKSRRWDGNLIELESVLAAAVPSTPTNLPISADSLR